MLPVIFGFSGTRLTSLEQEFFRKVQPYGYILFRRNVENPTQLQSLTANLRAISPQANLPILIDQEGGRVQRMAAPHWPVFPSLSVYGKLWEEQGAQAAMSACYAQQYHLAQLLADVGITVNCTPVLDIPEINAHPIIGDRALSLNPEIIAQLGQIVIKAHRDAGGAAIIKHIPGHGRAPADSHETLPVVMADAGALLAHDIRPFQALNDARFAMTAHVLYPAWDEHQPASTSPYIIKHIIRDVIGFKGVLVSDDLGMKALKGTMASRAMACLSAGCDVVLHCSGEMKEMEEIVTAVGSFAG
jgi:beta-N-acetylhexosaminidase